MLKKLLKIDIIAPYFMLIGFAFLVIMTFMVKLNLPNDEDILKYLLPMYFVMSVDPLLLITETAA